MMFLAAFLAAVSQQVPEPQIRICGEVTARRMLAPACDTVLHVKTSENEYDVFIPAAVANNLSIIGGRLRGAQVCFSGLAGPSSMSPRMRVLAASGVEIVTAPPGVSSSSSSVAVVPCGNHMTLPRVLEEKKPEYTGNAMRAKVEGTVAVEVIVGIDGTVSEARIIRSLHPELDDLALQAARQWRFVPGAINGKPAAMLVDIDMTFKLK